MKTRALLLGATMLAASVAVANPTAAATNLQPWERLCESINGEINGLSCSYVVIDPRPQTTYLGIAFLRACELAGGTVILNGGPFAGVASMNCA